MINTPPPRKGLNIRIPILIPSKGRGLLIRGLGKLLELGLQVDEGPFI